MILNNYKKNTVTFIKNILILADLITLTFNIPRDKFANIIWFIHILLMTKTMYVLHFQDPNTNLYYYLYNNFFWFVAISNFLLRGCILVKIERHLYNDKNYIGPGTFIIVKLSNIIGIYEYKNKVRVQNILAGLSFVVTLIVANYKINSNNILNEI